MLFDGAKKEVRKNRKRCCNTASHSVTKRRGIAGRNEVEIDIDDQCSCTASVQEVFHVGEQGLCMLSYVHARGSKDQFDIKPP